LSAGAASGSPAGPGDSRQRLEALLAGLGARWLDASSPGAGAQRDSMATFALAPDALAEAVRRLRERGGFETATLLTAVDRFPASPRFELVVQLLSLAARQRVRLVAALADDEQPRAPSLVALYPGAAFMERECYDMFGICFDGHRDLRRLLMPEEYGHHPLRKDFPHQGIQPDRLYREWDARRRGERPPASLAGGRA
jgi:NADH-quinone oxidoreductase subunit C